MKCAHCDQEIEPGARFCGGCYRDLPEGAAAPRQEPPAAPSLAAIVQDIAQACEVIDGFSRPNWKLVFQAIGTQFAVNEERDQALQELVLQWLNLIRDELGGEYVVYRTDRFFLVTDAGEATAKLFAGFGERAEKMILEHLGEVAWNNWAGMKVVLLFSDDDDYYHYHAHYDPEGVHATSLGSHIQQGYPHIVIHLADELESLRTLAHELVHSCLCHLPLPLWLNEGVTLTLQKAVEGTCMPAAGKDWSAWAGATGWTAPIIWREIAEQHRKYWNEERLQAFWAGTSFYEPGEASELSYHLAELWVNQLSKDRTGFMDFLCSARYEDGGQSAALDCLKIDLGEIAGSFLGEGDWRPQRDRIKRCWEARMNHPPPGNALEAE